MISSTKTLSLCTKNINYLVTEYVKDTLRLIEFTVCIQAFMYTVYVRITVRMFIFKCAVSPVQPFVTKKNKAITLSST